MEGAVNSAAEANNQPANEHSAENVAKPHHACHPKKQWQENRRLCEMPDGKAIINQGNPGQTPKHKSAQHTADMIWVSKQLVDEAWFHRLMLVAGRLGERQRIRRDQVLL